MDGSIDELHDDDHPLFGSDDTQQHVPGARKRAHRHQQRRRRRRRRIAPIIAGLVIVVLVGASYVLVRSVAGNFRTPDYAGSGQGFTQVKVAAGDGADDVGATMVKDGVVKSTRAFVNAAKKSGKSGDIQPGVYRVRLQSSGAAAMAAILDPANKLTISVTVPEGYIAKQVLSTLATKTGLPLAQFTAAAAKIGNLGIPAGYAPKSAEGFLFPSTYNFDPGTSADEILQAMVAQYASQESATGFQAAAKAAGLTPYAALIIASIAEAEAKFDADRAKVARVIMNRLATPSKLLQVDATSAYAGKLLGQDPSKVIYDKIVSPYNTYDHAGLPPTPIGNPGASSLKAAVSAPAGKWLFYVNIDAAGHLGFFTDEASFDAASKVCHAKGWGCG